MTIIIAKKTKEGLEIGADSGAWRGKIFRGDFNKILEHNNLIFAGTGHWDVIRTLEGFIQSKEITINNTIDVLKLLKEFLEILPTPPVENKPKDIDFIIYDKSTHTMFVIDNLTYVAEQKEEEPYIIGSCHDMAFVLLKENNGIKETIEKCIKYSTNVGGKVNIIHIEKTKKRTDDL